MEAKRLAYSSKPQKPDLVLTNMVIENMGGYELVTILVKEFSGLKILFMSGFTEYMTQDDDTPLKTKKLY